MFSCYLLTHTPYLCLFLYLYSSLSHTHTHTYELKHKSTRRSDFSTLGRDISGKSSSFVHWEKRVKVLPRQKKWWKQRKILVSTAMRKDVNSKGRLFKCEECCCVRWQIQLFIKINAKPLTAGGVVSTAEAVFLKLEDFHVVPPSGEMLGIAALRSCIPMWRIRFTKCNFLCFVGLVALLYMQISCCKSFHVTEAYMVAGILTIFILVP